MMAKRATKKAAKAASKKVSRKKLKAAVAQGRAKTGRGPGRPRKASNAEWSEDARSNAVTAAALGAQFIAALADAGDVVTLGEAKSALNKAYHAIRG